MLARRLPRLPHPLRLLCTTAANTKSPPSIFSPDVSPWDNIFDDIKDSPPPPNPSVHARSLRYHAAGRPHGQKPPRAIAMTHSESRVFDQMFNAIFSDHSTTPSVAPGIGQHGTSLYHNLRQRSRNRWHTEPDEDLDRKKEEMELCESDLQLLEWAMREVFGESQRYEEAARRAAEPLCQKQPDSSQRPSSSSISGPTPTPQHLQPSSYPHLLAALMRNFRDKYKNPHLALAMFDHARNLSIASYVFGCTTPAYNELIETRWQCFRDVSGVCDALEEMRVNGVGMDGRTRLLVETVRREVGERTLWQEESSLGSGEVWEMVARMERLTTRQKPKRSRRAPNQLMSFGNMRKQRWTADREEWKKRALDVDAKDGWGFDKWEERNSSFSPLQ